MTSRGSNARFAQSTGACFRLIDKLPVSLLACHEGQKSLIVGKNEFLQGKYFCDHEFRNGQIGKAKFSWIVHLIFNDNESFRNFEVIE